MSDDLKQIFEQKAKAGDGAFAVAYAILELADSNYHIAQKVARLGIEGPGSVPAPGALEYIGIQLREMTTALECLTVSASVSINSD